MNNKTRYYVNFASLVDGKILCKYFKTEKEAQSFAIRLKCKYYFSINATEYSTNVIDEEIWQASHNENYIFNPETHYLMEHRFSSINGMEI